MKVKKKKSPTATARANLIRFCEILDKLPIGFILKLDNVSKESDGSWKKIVSDGTTAWENGSRILFNSSFFPKRNQVLEAIEREGWQVRKLYSPETKPKPTPVLTKEKVKELYYKEKKSLKEIGDQYGYSRQWIELLMEKYRLNRRTRSEAREEAIIKSKKNDANQKKIPNKLLKEIFPEKLSRSPSTEQIYTHLKKMIVSGKLKKEKKLLQEKIAQDFGVSRVTVGIAFSRLKKDGLIVSKRGAGSFVV